MAFDPIFPNWAGILPILQNARTIIERDIEEALAWSFGASTPGPVYSRIQYTQRHSRVYPLLVMQPATTTPEALNGGVLQRHVFDCEIYLTRSIDSGNLSDEIDTLATDLIRYFDATMMCLLSAPASDWQTDLSDGQGKVRVWCTNGVFGQLFQSREAKGEYLHSMAFELQVDLIESE